MNVIARILSALPDLGLGVAFLITLFQPKALGDSMVKYAMLTMLLEFIVIHSAAFMGLVLWGPLPTLKKIGATLGLGVMYSTFLLAFWLALDEFWPIWAFWGLIANRMASALLSRDGSEKVHARMVAGWGLSVLWYLLWVFATTLLPMPAFGITPDVIATSGIGGEGLWVDQPYRVVIAGAGYFLSQGVTELLGWNSGGAA
jgi:hypothetical protein